MERNKIGEILTDMNDLSDEMCFIFDIVNNLVADAIKFTHDNGHLKVHVRSWKKQSWLRSEMTELVFLKNYSRFFLKNTLTRVDQG